MKREIVTYFSGGGFAEIAAREAGLTPVCGVEIDDAIADVYERNHGRHIIRKPVQMIDPSQVPAAYWFHASPVCTRASNANSGAEECELDIEMARAVVAYITTHKPPRVSIENVWMYRTFEAFEVIRRALVDEGYSVDWWHLNAADFGTPQTRKRLYLMASREGRVKRPMPTHHDASDGQASMFTSPWHGWLWAIEDLLDFLPVSSFAKWQLARLPTALSVSSENLPRALVVEGSAAGLDNKFNLPVRAGDEPIFTMRARQNNPRAWLVNQDSKLGVVGADSPAMTILSSPKSQYVRALLVDGKLNNRSESVTSREGEAPCFTLTTSHNMRDVRAWLPLGRVVKMSPRAIYRFQAGKGRDWYELPPSPSLASKVIGNGVAVDCFKAVLEANL